MKQLAFIFAIITLFILGSCEKDVIPTTGSISGKVSLYDPTAPLANKTPLEGIKLYLIDSDFPFDTINYEGNLAAIVDSTVSDADGIYRFTNVPFGNYMVSPVPDTTYYQFEPENETAGADPGFSLNQANPRHEFNIKAQIPGSTNSDDEYTIHFRIINYDESLPNNYYHQVYIMRQLWLVWIIPNPLGYRNYKMGLKLEQDTSYYSFTAKYVYSDQGNFYANNYLVSVYDGQDSHYNFFITWGLVVPPSNCYYTIDFNNRTITYDGESGYKD